MVIESAPFSGDAVSSATVPVAEAKPDEPVKLPASKVMSLTSARLKLAGVRALVSPVPYPLVTLIGPVLRKGLGTTS